MGEEPISEIYRRLNEHYGDLHWWPAQHTYEMMVGAILTQNTSWENVKRALDCFEGNLTPQRVEAMTNEELAAVIKPAGFFNQKATYLKTLTEWYKRYNYDAKEVQKHTLAALRAELLALKGVGAETADSILLYGFGKYTFVVDAYTKRLLKRCGVEIRSRIIATYDDIKALFEGRVDEKNYNNYHAVIVENAKQHCRAKPQCNGCPLAQVKEGLVV